MRYLLDTDAFSDLVRGVPNVKARFSLAGLASVRISAVTVKEIEYGRRRHPERVTRRGVVIDTYLREIEALPFDIQDAYSTGFRASQVCCSKTGGCHFPKCVKIGGSIAL